MSTRAQRGKPAHLLTLVVASSLISLVVVSLAWDVSAQRARRAPRRGAAAAAAPAAPAEAPQSAEIATALSDAGIRWGMTPRESFDHFTKVLNDDFRPRLAKAPGSIEEDRLRSQLENEIRRMRTSFVRFTGQTTGLESSFLGDEFTHGNNESMLVVREEQVHATSHYFFINDRLWKRYEAFDASAFPGATFDQFAEAIQRRFGPGVERSGSLVEGRPETRWIEWQDETTRLRAVDQTRFYGFFCLVFEDKSVLAQLPTLRSHTIARQSSRSALVESVMRSDDEGSAAGGDGGGDSHADIADRITGQIRRRTDAPEQPASPSTTRSRSGSSTRR